MEAVPELPGQGQPLPQPAAGQGKWEGSGGGVWEENSASGGERYT